MSSVGTSKTAAMAKRVDGDVTQTALGTRSHGISLQYSRTGDRLVLTRKSGYTIEMLTIINNYVEYYDLDTQTFSAADVPRRIWRLSTDSETVPS